MPQLAMKDAGNLDRLIQIKRPIESQTASGAVRQLWQVWRTCYANLEVEKTGGERYEARQLVEVKPRKWVVRVNREKPIDSTMILVYGAYEHRITKIEEFQIKDRASRNSYLLITTELRDNE
jgi:head-tail adaptor